MRNLLGEDSGARAMQRSRLSMVSRPERRLSKEEMEYTNRTWRVGEDEEKHVSSAYGDDGTPSLCGRERTPNSRGCRIKSYRSWNEHREDWD